ncbi:expressed unknown protein [Ectocarpus siliculosus]|uniref:Uncharacterized protein n=1 Tax=Ectocarpus siliculosus TaxID=2880 RepID=D8LSX4_ECTSI|nr:expressed unknown protein [Ectocarpus siliculosus]|eukprot:CBN77901.1 expressed unknown protein [Ectocarpus siliculosus]
MFPKREAVQQLKDRLQAWCAEENRREQEDVSLPGGTSREDRPPRRWQAYEFIPLPSRNRTLDSEVLGMNVGRSVNDTRLEVTVDFEKEDEALEVGMRLLDMMADVSREPNEVFGYADDAVTGGQQLGPWKKSGSVNSWRKWLELGDGEDPLPESAVTVFRTVQANWADPNKIAAAMNFTVFWSNARMEESMADPTTPLRRVEVLHSALHPHVIKIAETFASSDAMLDHFHRNYDGYLSGVFNFRAAVNPTVQAYTPLEASLRPCLSATLPTGAIVPLVAIGGAEDGVSPPTMIVLEGLKLGVRHFVLEVGSSGVKEAVEGLQAALAFGVVKRDHLFVTMIVGESNSAVAGGRGIAAAVSETLASGRVDDGGIETDGTATRLLDSVDALVLARESGEYFDDDRLFLEMWDEAHQAAASPPRESTGLPAVPTEQTGLDTPADDDPFGSPFDIPADSLAADSPAAKSSSSSSSSADGSNDELDSRLGSHLGVGGHGSKVADRLALLVDQSPAAGAAAADVPGTVPRKLPSLYFGDLRAGDGAATTATIELCRERGVQAFSLECAGGRGAEEARKGAAAAADYEHEDVTDDEVLAKWVMEIDGGVVWRPREVKEVARVLPLARYYLPPEWISEIADRGGCPPEAWARTLSRLCPSEGTPSEEQLGAEVEETVAGLMTPDDGEEADGVGDSYDGLWGMDDDE